MSDSATNGASNVLSPVQRRIVGYALTAFAVVALIAVALGFFWVLRAFVTTFSQVLWPLAIAAILATLLKPLVACIEKRLNLTRNKSIALMYALVLLVLAFLLTSFISLIDSQVIAFFRSLPELVTSLGGWLQKNYPDTVDLITQYVGTDDLQGLVEKISENLKAALAGSLAALQKGGAGLLRFFGWVAALAIIPIYLFFLLQTDRDFGRDLDTQMNFLPDGLREDLMFLSREFVQILVAFFRGQLIIALIMGVLYATGFSLAGLRFGIILGLALGMLNIVPYLGTMLGLAIVIPIAWFQSTGGMFFDSGGLGMALACLAVFGAVQTLEGYLLTPQIMNQQTGLHPMVIIIAIFFWGAALNGILGMILAIPLTAFFVIAWRLVRKKYLPRLTGQDGKVQEAPG